MKIFILPVDPRFRPHSQVFKYPAHNEDYGVEQDFLAYLYGAGRSLVVTDPRQAHRHYLPIYWTRWHLNHDYGKQGIDELQAEVDRCIVDAGKSFTICQYDDGPIVDIGGTVQFLASRRSRMGIDIPLLSSPHRKPIFPIRKQFLASFLGRTATHPIRIEMMNALQGRGDVLIKNVNIGSGRFVRSLLASHIALCPRGYGGSSFRFYEAMQLGVVPFLIGDIDTRPFKRHIPWERISLYSNTITEAVDILNRMKIDVLKIMGDEARSVYSNDIAFQLWCKYVIMELEELS